jgi:dolichol kinase
MFAVIFSLLGVFIILVVNEILWRKKIFHGELKRKFVHILATIFIAFWPWFLSWKTVQFLGIAMAVVLLLNRQLRILHYLGNIRQKTYGEVFLALAVTVCALITDEKAFFTIAMLQVALADGLAAIIGSKFGGNWRYQVFHQTKSVVGSMTFWVTSLCVLGIGLLSAHDVVEFNDYVFLLILLPPVLMVVENVAAFGLDNLAIPIVAIAILQIVAA